VEWVPPAPNCWHPSCQSGAFAVRKDRNLKKLFNCTLCIMCASSRCAPFFPRIFPPGPVLGQTSETWEKNERAPLSGPFWGKKRALGPAPSRTAESKHFPLRVHGFCPPVFWVGRTTARFEFGVRPTLACVCRPARICGGYFEHGRGCSGPGSRRPSTLDWNGKTLSYRPPTPSLDDLSP